jgi:hypothetical protein
MDDFLPFRGLLHRSYAFFANQVTGFVRNPMRNKELKHRFLTKPATRIRGNA